MAVGPESGRNFMISRARGSVGLGDGPRTITRLFLCALSTVTLSLGSWSQSTAGRILGSVTDQSGAAVVGATVVVTDIQRGTTRNLTTDDTGGYVASDLQPGTYKIHLQAKGFKAVERPNVLIEVATDVLADFTLQPGQVNET